jgi:NAD(P)-dependent dehydrogenase (short-subunit alcohol dehydrogenase family)
MSVPRKGLMLLGAGLAGALAARVFLREPFDFRGKVIVITGGSRGLGLALARQLADAGARLALLARDEGELERAAQDIASRGANVLTLACDVREEAGVARAIGEVVARWGGVDVLINNAGVIQVGPLDHMTTDDFANALATHFWGPLHTTLAVLPHMRRRGGGRIVNISSIGGRVAVPHLLPYSASKFALVGLSDGLRAELAAEKIKVTTVSPGLMRTGSHYNAQFKGQHARELAWFALFDALPISSISVERAARQIVEACRRGDPSLTISWQAQLLAAANALLPSVGATLTAAMARFLPRPTGPEGDIARTGWESQSAAAPSLLTRLGDKATVEYNGLNGHRAPA